MLDTTETNLKVLTVINTDDALLGLLSGLDVRRETLRDYRYRLASFVAFVSGRGRFDHNVLIDYKKTLAEQDCSVATKNKMLTAAKRLTYLLYASGIIDRDISGTAKCFQQSKVHKKQGLTEEEQIRIVHWINRNPDKVRERALIYLLLFQGLRQAEVCNLHYYDVDFKQNYLHVLGKGRDDKEPLIMQEDVRRTLKEYIERNPSESTNGFLFTSERRQSQDGGLTTRGLAVIIKGIFEELDIDRNVHAFRHSFTTTLVKKLPNLLEVAQLTRHRSVEMLQVYNDELKTEERTMKLNAAFSGLSEMLTV